MEAIERFVAHDLFTTAEQTAAKLLELKGGSVPEGVPTNPFEFRVTFLELLGKTASDLVHGELDLPKKVEVAETKVGCYSPSSVSGAGLVSDVPSLAKWNFHRREVFGPTLKR